MQQKLKGHVTVGELCHNVASVALQIISIFSDDTGFIKSVSSTTDTALYLVNATKQFLTIFRKLGTNNTSCAAELIVCVPGCSCLEYRVAISNL